MRHAGLAALVARLGAALDALGDDGVREVLGAHVASLAPTEGERFVMLFEQGVAPDDASAGLLAEIDERIGVLPEVAHELASYRQRRRHRGDVGGWQPEVHPVRDEVDEMFGRVGARFLAGDWATAIAGYRRLLDAAVDDIDTDEAMAVPASPEVLLEGVSRLVRALLSDPAQPATRRATAAVEAVEAYHLLGAPGVEEVLAAHPSPIPDHDATVDAWARASEERARQERAWHSRAHHEIASAALLARHGVDELARLALDEDYPHRHDATVAWIDHLDARGRTADAIDAGRRALATMRRSWERARVADRVAMACRTTGDDAAAAEVQLASFDDRPGLDALAWLCHDHHGPPTPVADRLLAADVHEPTVAVAVAILAGDLSRLTASAAIGHGRDVSATAVAAGALLTAAAPSPGSVGAALADRLLATVDTTRPRSTLHARHTAMPALHPHLRAAIEAVARGEHHLDAARQLVDDTAAHVLGHKVRHAYRLVAEQVVAYAHVLDDRTSTPVTDTIDTYRQRYKRFSAFRSELDTARATAG